MSYIPNSGSVVAFQGTVPFSVLGQNTGSIISVQQGSVAAVIVGGSIATSSPANQSVSGTVNVGNFPASQAVITQPSIAVNIIAGSIAASFTPPANQSVSGTVQVDVRGSVATVIIGGSIATTTGNSSVQVLNFPTNQSVSGAVSVSNFPTTQNVSGSVVSFQGTSPWVDVIQGSVATVIIGGSILTTSTANQSVSGTVGASIIGSVPVTGNVFVNGSVAAILTASTNQSVSGTVGASIVGIGPVTLTANTVASSQFGLNGVTANTVGSTISTVGMPMTMVQITSNPSINGVVNFEGTADNSAWVPIQAVNISTYQVSSLASSDGDWSINTTALQGVRTRLSNWTAGSIFTRGFAVPMGDARITVASGNQSVSGAVFISGSVLSQQTGTVITSVSGNVTVVSSLAGGIFPVSGSVAAVVTNSVNVNGSVAAFMLGNSSILNIWRSPSIVGTYLEDAAHTSADRGLFVLGVRNDTMASVTSADVEYGPITIGVAGEIVAANGATLTKWVQGTADFRQGNTGASIIVVANGVASIFQYITGVQVANMGSASVLVTLAAGGSTLGYTIAPAGGGSNILYPNALKTPGSFGLAASISGIASVLVSAQGFISKV